MKNLKEIKFMMERIESPRMTDTEFQKRFNLLMGEDINGQKILNVSDVSNSNFISEGWRDNDTITREMILNIIQTMTQEEAANEIYEMISEICRYR